MLLPSVIAILSRKWTNTLTSCVMQRFSSRLLPTLVTGRQKWTSTRKIRALFLFITGCSRTNEFFVSWWLPHSLSTCDERYAHHRDVAFRSSIFLLRHSILTHAVAAHWTSCYRIEVDKWPASLWSCKTIPSLQILSTTLRIRYAPEN